MNPHSRRNSFFMRSEALTIHMQDTINNSDLETGLKSWKTHDIDKFSSNLARVLLACRIFGLIICGTVALCFKLTDSGKY